jgi:hypothetical protein
MGTLKYFAAAAACVDLPLPGGPRKTTTGPLTSGCARAVAEHTTYAEATRKSQRAPL